MTDGPEVVDLARVVSAAAGDLPMNELTAAERAVLNAQLSARILRLVEEVNFGAALASRGVTTVALDEHGNLLEYRPDGSTAPIRDA